MLLAPAFGGAQALGRKVMFTGTVRSVPSGTRFALGTRLGTFSVEAKGSTFVLGGKDVRFADLRFGSSVAIIGTLTPGTGIARATIVATRIEVATTPTPGTARRRTASKKG